MKETLWVSGWVSGPGYVPPVAWINSECDTVSQVLAHGAHPESQACSFLSLAPTGLVEFSGVPTRLSHHDKLLCYPLHGIMCQI